MQMWSGGSSRAAAQTDDFSALYLVAFFHFEFGKMQIEGEQPLPVIEHDEIALEIERPRQQHCATIHGGDGSTAGDAEIHAQVWTRGLTVENTLRAENVGDGRVGGRSELARPFALGSNAVQIVLLDLLSFLNLLLLFGGGLGEFSFHAKLDRNFRILAADDDQLARE